MKSSACGGMRRGRCWQPVVETSLFGFGSAFCQALLEDHQMAAETLNASLHQMDMKLMQNTFNLLPVTMNGGMATGCCCLPRMMTPSSAGLRTGETGAVRHPSRGSILPQSGPSPQLPAVDAWFQHPPTEAWPFANATLPRRRRNSFQKKELKAMACGSAWESWKRPTCPLFVQWIALQPARDMAAWHRVAPTIGSRFVKKLLAVCWTNHSSCWMHLQ